MDKNKTTASKMTLTFGIIGCIAGLFLLFSENYMMGIFGAIASVGIAVKGYGDLKKIQDKN